MHPNKSVAFVYAGSHVYGHLLSLVVFFSRCRLTAWERQSGLCKWCVSVCLVCMCGMCVCVINRHPSRFVAQKQDKTVS